MAAVLPDIIDRMVALLQGTYTSAPRSISSGRFKLIPFEVERALPNASQRPRPFEIRDDGEVQPLDVPSSLAGDQVWHGAGLTLRVGYALAANDQHTQMQEIQRDRYEIRRALGYPDNYNGVTGFSRAIADEGEIVDAEIQQGENISVMLVLEVPIEITYREDHTS